MLFPHDLPDADVQHLRGWVAAHGAVRLRSVRQSEGPWEIHRSRMFGNWVGSPRLGCWIGDPKARYRYSGAGFVPHPWLPALQAVRDRLETGGLDRFNSVLLNRYRGGSDYMGWHSDDEPELGPAPVIASLSLGASRRFLLRRRDDPMRKAEFLLGHGDLLVMAGQTQRFYQHALPKMARVQGERINLTFRWIAPR